MRRFGEVGKTFWCTVDTPHQADVTACYAGPSRAVPGARRATRDGSSESAATHRCLRRGCSTPHQTVFPKPFEPQPITLGLTQQQFNFGRRALRQHRVSGSCDEHRLTAGEHSPTNGITMARIDQVAVEIDLEAERRQSCRFEARLPQLPRRLIGGRFIVQRRFERGPMAARKMARSRRCRRRYGGCGLSRHPPALDDCCNTRRATPG